LPELSNCAAQKKGLPEAGPFVTGAPNY
jgi:hypothetical protein